MQSVKDDNPVIFLGIICPSANREVLPWWDSSADRNCFGPKVGHTLPKHEPVWLQRCRFAGNDATREEIQADRFLSVGLNGALAGQ